MTPLATELKKHDCVCKQLRRSEHVAIYEVFFNNQHRGYDVFTINKSRGGVFTVTNKETGEPVSREIAPFEGYPAVTAFGRSAFYYNKSEIERADAKFAELEAAAIERQARREERQAERDSFEEPATK